MPAHIKVSGTWKSLEGMHTKVSGTWKAVQGGYIKVSGVWKQFFFWATLFAGGDLGRSENQGGGSLSVGVRFNADGTYDKRDGGSWSLAGYWLTGSSLPADVGDDWEVEVTATGGDSELQPALADGLYKELTANRDYSATVNPGADHSATFSYTVREIADTANNATGIFDYLTEGPE